MKLFFMVRIIESKVVLKPSFRLTVPYFLGNKATVVSNVKRWL